MNELVYWTPINGNQGTEEATWLNLLAFEPEPVLKYIRDERNGFASYLRCPAFKDYYRNTFLIRCPMDLKLTVEKDLNGNKVLRTHSYDQTFFNKNISDRLKQSDLLPTMSVDIGNIFYSKGEVVLEQLSLSMGISQFDTNMNVISGEFDISKWIRPVYLGIEILDETKPIILKRGMPLYFIRFRTSKKVKLIRKELTKDIQLISNSCLSLKSITPFNTMKENYEHAKEFMKMYKRKLFKCPFAKNRREL